MSGRDSLLEKHRWLVFVLPFAVYMLVGAMEPSRDVADSRHGELLGQAVEYAPAYSMVYTGKIVLTLAAMAFVLPGYREFRCPPGRLAVLAGVVGIIVWVGFCYLSDRCELTRYLTDRLTKLHLYSPRSELRPLDELASSPVWAWTFLGVRFFGLVIVVPIIEEFFLRGFLMRVVMEADWWKVPFGKLNSTAAVVSIAWPLLTHQPGEYLAGIAWFGMVTWLMVRTRNPWDCVAAHAVTNLLLGIYVVVWQQWALW